MAKIIVGFLCFLLLSCSTVTRAPESLSSDLKCTAPLAKKVAILRIQDESENAVQSIETVEPRKENTLTPLEADLEKTGCFENVRIISSESESKDFDRLIKLQMKLAPKSKLEMTGRLAWMFVSLSTLLLIPYIQDDEGDLTLEDSKTGFKKSYQVEVRSSMHLFYFFKDWTMTAPSPEVNAAILKDFINELKGKK